VPSVPCRADAVGEALPREEVGRVGPAGDMLDPVLELREKVQPQHSAWWWLKCHCCCSHRRFASVCRSKGLSRRYGRRLFKLNALAQGSRFPVARHALLALLAGSRPG
jgi:hypothetical protein